MIFSQRLSFLSMAAMTAAIAAAPATLASPVVPARSHVAAVKPAGKNVRAAVARKSVVKTKITTVKAKTTAKTAAAKTAVKPTATYGRVRTPPDSYLRYKVYSVAQLVAQVKADPHIRKVYARHFGIPETRVVSYMQANLVESYVPKTGRYTVYCVRRNGKIYSVRQTFRKGTKVFALRNGQPVMKWVCGNPLSTKLPPTKVTPVTENVGESLETLTPTDLADVFVPSELAPVAVAPILGGPTILGAAPIFFGGGGSGLGFLFPIGLILGSTGGGGGGSQFSPPPPVTLPVPEPSAPMMLVALMVAGGATVAKRRGIRRK